MTSTNPKGVDNERGNQHPNNSSSFMHNFYSGNSESSSQKEFGQGEKTESDDSNLFFNEMGGPDIDFNFNP